MNLDIKSKYTLRKICEFLNPLIDKVKIRKGGLEIIYISKLGILRRKRKIKSLKEILFLDIPNFLSIHNYGNYKWVDNYIMEIEDIMKDVFLTKEQKVKKIINYYHNQLAGSKIRDTVNDISIIRIFPKMIGKSTKTRSSMKIALNIQRNRLKGKGIKSNRIFEVNEAKEVRIKENKGSNNILLDFTRKNFNSTKRIAIIGTVLLSLSIGRMLYSIQNIDFINYLPDVPFTDLCRGPMKLWFFVT